MKYDDFGLIKGRITRPECDNMTKTDNRKNYYLKHDGHNLIQEGIERETMANPLGIPREDRTAYQRLIDSYYSWERR